MTWNIFFERLNSVQKIDVILNACLLILPECAKRIMLAQRLWAGQFSLVIERTARLVSGIQNSPQWPSAKQIVFSRRWLDGFKKGLKADDLQYLSHDVSWSWH